ncbi:MAG TPA: hypothetical protein VK137_05195 [Planctomycetaceae bacterium]|nr:hypothetical protein [Planctomycetaceae bacterium]
MARERNKVSPEVAQRLVDLAREMRQLVYGESGVPKWGTKFSQIESEGMAVGHELARLMMEQSVEDQAGQVPAEALDTGGEVAGLAGTEEMLLETPAGEVEWQQPRGVLKTSRRDFFPSGPSLGRGCG